MTWPWLAGRSLANGKNDAAYPLFTEERNLEGDAPKALFGLCLVPRKTCGF